MKITVIHGQSHKGVTYKMTHTVLEFLELLQLLRLIRKGLTGLIL